MGIDLKRDSYYQISEIAQLFDLKEETLREAMRDPQRRLVAATIGGATLVRGDHLIKWLETFIPADALASLHSAAPPPVAGGHHSGVMPAMGASDPRNNAALSGTGFGRRAAPIIGAPQSTAPAGLMRSGDYDDPMKPAPPPPPAPAAAPVVPQVPHPALAGGTPSAQPVYPPTPGLQPSISGSSSILAAWNQSSRREPASPHLPPSAPQPEVRAEDALRGLMDNDTRSDEDAPIRPGRQVETARSRALDDDNLFGEAPRPMIDLDAPAPGGSLLRLAGERHPKGAGASATGLVTTGHGYEHNPHGKGIPDAPPVPLHSGQQRPGFPPPNYRPTSNYNIDELVQEVEELERRRAQGEDV